MEAQPAAAAPAGLSRLTGPLKIAVFGKNNERLEYVMDSYFKLSPEARTGVIAAAWAGGIVLFLMVIGIYIMMLGHLQNRLDTAFTATNRLSEARQSYQITKQRFDELERRLASANENFVLFSVLEQKAKDLGLQTGGFPPQLPVVDFPSANPLSEKYQSAKVEFRVSNASLKKIIEFVVAIESTPHLLRVSSLKVRGLFANKLFFDAILEVEATVAKR